ncbi:unnamed protein product [Ectocarpus fasciculatus]
MDRRLGRPLPHQLPNPTRAHPIAINLSPEGRIRYSVLLGRFPRVTHPSATPSEEGVRLACVKPAASVRSEPESNSQVL